MFYFLHNGIVQLYITLLLICCLRLEILFLFSVFLPAGVKWCRPWCCNIYTFLLGVIFSVFGIGGE